MYILFSSSLSFILLGPNYVNVKLRTFVCSTCAGILREFQFNCKGISMTTFSADEVKSFKQGGNKRARKEWLAKWSAKEFPEPESSEKNRIREFMRLKYEEKKWYKK